MPCMDALNQTYMTTVGMVKQYRRPQRQTAASQSQRRTSVTSGGSDHSERLELAAVKIQALVRMNQAQYRWVGAFYSRCQPRA